MSQFVKFIHCLDNALFLSNDVKKIIQTNHDEFIKACFDIKNDLPRDNSELHELIRAIQRKIMRNYKFKYTYEDVLKYENMYEENAIPNGIYTFLDSVNHVTWINNDIYLFLYVMTIVNPNILYTQSFRVRFLIENYLNNVVHKDTRYTADLKIEDIYFCLNKIEWKSLSISEHYNNFIEHVLEPYDIKDGNTEMKYIVANMPFNICEPIWTFMGFLKLRSTLNRIKQINRIRPRCIITAQDFRIFLKVLDE